MLLAGEWVLRFPPAPERLNVTGVGGANGIMATAHFTYPMYRFLQTPAKWVYQTLPILAQDAQLQGPSKSSTCRSRCSAIIENINIYWTNTYISDTISDSHKSIIIIYTNVFKMMRISVVTLWFSGHNPTCLRPWIPWKPTKATNTTDAAGASTSADAARGVLSRAEVLEFVKELLEGNLTGNP